MKSREGLKSLIELASLQNQVKALRLRDKFGKQNFAEDIEKVFERVTDIVKAVSKDITKTVTGISEENNRALANWTDKRLEVMNDRGRSAI